MCFFCQLYLCIKWRHVAAIMVRKEHRRRHSLDCCGGGDDLTEPQPKLIESPRRLPIIFTLYDVIFVAVVGTASLLLSQELLRMWEFAVVPPQSLSVDLQRCFHKTEAIRWFLEFTLLLVPLLCHENMPYFPDDTIKFLLG